MVETMNDTVEVTQPVSVQDDAVQEQATPNALEEFMADTEPTEDNETSQQADKQPQPQQAQTEDEVPKGIRGRIQAAQAKADRSGYERGRQEAESAYQAKIAEYEQKLAKYADMEVTLEAQELSRKEHISLDLAKRVIRAEKGMGAAQAQEAPQQAQTQQAQPAFNRDALRVQYENIRDVYGVDLLAEGVLKDDELDGIVSGRSDFNAAMLRILYEQQTAKAQPTPPPVKNGGGRPTQTNYDFMSMTDEEFDRFNDKISSGRAFRPR